MLDIGFLSSRRNKSISNFYLGGHTLEPLVTAISGSFGYELLSADGLARSDISYRHGGNESQLYDHRIIGLADGILISQGILSICLTKKGLLH